MHSEHLEKTRQIKEHLHSPAVLEKTAEVFKIFGDSGRLGILSALMDGELPVCCIAEILSMSQSAVSHQLRVLKSARLVRSHKVGREVYYSLDDAHIDVIIHAGISHVKEDNI